MQDTTEHNQTIIDQFSQEAIPFVEGELEQQLKASFPNPGEAKKIR
ncbi:hypothetical protein METHB2_890008 [Candidatus Methylobacter favarea]|uniref:Uncharacterized protein n=1 Tax=Candidatus Methylobacter favarea TaxID=2707345 RepID=A0A8S0WLV4_9GAMM|nr:hypothetical protein [Candidatus Methylobacter favarea]CAA9892890.1 hypothetical protein METHB2_890008 [Candidatus Methylobacter favarea]